MRDNPLRVARSFDDTGGMMSTFFKNDIPLGIYSTGRCIKRLDKAFEGCIRPGLVRVTPEQRAGSQRRSGC